ncbi:MAG: calcium/sodium antiporter [Eubacterium sp.]|nr:calcium/sodium antiporter [Eubacterium sp.]
MKELFVPILLLIIGFVLLIEGADFFVEACSSIAKRFHIPSIIIGLTIVAMGTSLPECAVSVTASIADNNALAVSNAVGSNIFNLMVVCGACALFTPLIVTKGTLRKDFPISIVCAILLLGLAFLIPGSHGTVGRVGGSIMLAVFTAYLISMIVEARKNPMTVEEDYELLPTWKCILFILGGAAAIKFGGDAVVNGASAIASRFGLSDELIGLTIVALGTSLPELVTSLVASKKGEVDMAVGNVIGSNIFNLLLVLGVASVISPITISLPNVYDTVILVAVSVLVWLFAWSKERITRLEGALMLLIYGGYMVYICMR